MENYFVNKIGISEKKRKFIVVSSEQKYGGTIALHALSNYLNEMGHDSKVLYAKDMYYKKGRRYKFWIHYIIDNFFYIFKCILVKILGPSYFETHKSFAGIANPSVKKVKHKATPFISQNTIVVYPDIAYGNFLHADKCVRWLLYNNRFDLDRDAYGEHDLFFCYREVFNDFRLNPECNTLYTPYFDLNFYKRTYFGERHGNCYIIRKGKTRTDLPKSFDGIVIDDLPETKKVEVFNHCLYCYSYDMQTAYSQIAALCGCISILIPEVGKKYSDYYGAEERQVGVAFGNNREEIQYAQNTMADIYGLFKEKNEQAKKSVNTFVDVCEKYFID